MPFETPRGFKMADPTIGPNRHIAKHSIYVATLEEVAEKLGRGLSLWMKQRRNGRSNTLASRSFGSHEVPEARTVVRRADQDLALAPLLCRPWCFGDMPRIGVRTPAY